ncbi:hypothetical protein ACFWJ4_41180 [Kitasatospora sp. NPDC127067]|uniref:hypothetical protein n=1 Tax=Kitasatospora sp. NPDC127067 TaxID=3347126 RepID=UPI0036480125
MSDPASGGWRMPAETGSQTRTWTAWPARGYARGEDSEEAGQPWAKAAKAAKAIVAHCEQPVTVS